MNDDSTARSLFPDSINIDIYHKFDNVIEITYCVASMLL